MPVKVLVAFFAWAAVAATLPRLQRRWGWPGLRLGIHAATLTAAATALLALAQSWAPEALVGTALALAATAWLVECFGQATGIPFGRYAYTDRLRPHLGRVPVAVPLAYLGVVPI